MLWERSFFVLSKQDFYLCSVLMVLEIMHFLQHLSSTAGQVANKKMSGNKGQKVKVPDKMEDSYTLTEQ